MADQRRDDGATADEGTTGGKLKGTRRSALAGSMFLMATSAIGPGFLTQTADFTAKLGAAFAFAILVSILVDIAIQLNVWRVIGVSGRRAQELGNEVLPGLGWVLTLLIVIGGLAFNVGNVAGAGLGTDALIGLEPKIGGGASAVIAIAIFLSRKAGVAMDRIVVTLGFVMIALTLYVAVTSNPPLGQALRNSVAPEGGVPFFAATTLIGGTIGGYITYSGAHRLIDAGIVGRESVREITRTSVTGVIVTGLMRIILFLAVLGVVAGGATLATDNPPASAFELAAGEVGLRLFGIVIWSAAITSVIGASYTSVSFMVSGARMSDRVRTWLVLIFIAVSTTVFLLAGAAPVTLLIFVGAFNGLLLPAGVGIVLWVAWKRPDLMHGYRYPRWLLVIGAVAWVLCIYLGYNSLEGLADLV